MQQQEPQITIVLGASQVLHLTNVLDELPGRTNTWLINQNIRQQAQTQMNAQAAKEIVAQSEAEKAAAEPRADAVPNRQQRRAANRGKAKPEAAVA